MGKLLLETLREIHRAANRAYWAQLHHCGSDYRVDYCEPCNHNLHCKMAVHIEEMLNQIEINLDTPTEEPTVEDKERTAERMPNQ